MWLSRWSLALVAGWAAGLLWPAASAAAPVVELRQPSAATVQPWGREAPVLPLEARLLLGGRPLVSERLYLTAVISSSQRPVEDRVPLFDDGSHGDSVAGDGCFRAAYHPARPGQYQVRCRAQWLEGGRPKEAFGERRAVQVVAVAWPQLFWPPASGRLGRQATAKVLLVRDGQAWTQVAAGDRVEVWATQGGRAQRPVLARRDGRWWLADLTFPALGSWVLQARFTTTAAGQPVQVAGDSVTINVARAPRLWILGLVLMGLAVARRRRVPCWRWTLTVKDSAGQPLATLELPRPSRPEPVTRTLGGEASTATRKLAAWLLRPLTVTAAPGQALVEVACADPLVCAGKTGLKHTLKHGEDLGAGGLTLSLQQSDQQEVRADWWQLGRGKAALLVIGLALFALGWWQRHGFYNG